MLKPLFMHPSVLITTSFSLQEICSILNLCSVLNTYLCVGFFFFFPLFIPPQVKEKNARLGKAK